MSIRLAEYIEANKTRLIEAWSERVGDVLAASLDESTLKDDLPDFIEDVAKLLRTPPEDWSVVHSAQLHGRSRVQLGIDIGALTEEMALLGGQVIELAERDGAPLSSAEMSALIRVVGRGTAESARAYASERDQQFTAEAARHFSFVAHEIRTPLQSAQLAARLLERGDERRDRHLEKLERALGHLAERVEAFLVGARRYGEDIAVDLEVVSARNLVNDALEEVQYHAAERDLSISVEVADFDLEVDPKLMDSALTNLLANAVKFTRPGGRVTIRARAEAERALLEVEDRCGGIPADLVPRLFLPFVQAGEAGGFGLGLAVVRQAAEAHQGSVRVQNLPGIGCRFLLDLPRTSG